MLVYLEHINNRIKYTFDFVFNNRSIDYTLTDDEGEFSASSEFKLNYSSKHLQADAHIVPASLILVNENRLFNTEKRKFFHEDCLCFDEIVDPFSSIFYVLSRMEEHHSEDFDHHNRFKSKNSILFQNNWLETPICDLWAEDILSFLTTKGLNYQKVEKYPVEIRPTFDIDNTYAYRLKTGQRKLMAVLKDMVKGNKQRLSERKNVLAGAHDPYDMFFKIEEISKRGFKVNVFWLLGDWAKFDRNISHKDPQHRSLIKKMSEFSDLGIHPSYRSANSQNIVSEEQNRLAEIIGQNVINSRQHFLRLRFPETYHSLLENGIVNDFTMGYAENVGFRAGTARPFKWFDLSKGEITNLTIHPFVYMDGTLNEYCHYSIDDAKSKITNLYQELEQFGGDFCFIWHNETIGDYGIWKGWSEVLEHSLNLKYE